MLKNPRRWPTRWRKRWSALVLEPTAGPVLARIHTGPDRGRRRLRTRSQRLRVGGAGRATGLLIMDIRALFDTVPWDLVLRAVEHHSREPWVLLYVKRWLEAPLRLPDSTISEQTMGTPGFRHFTLAGQSFHALRVDAWMARAYPAITFERSAMTRSCAAAARPRPSSSRTGSLQAGGVRA